MGATAAFRHCYQTLGSPPVNAGPVSLAGPGFNAAGTKNENAALHDRGVKFGATAQVTAFPTASDDKATWIEDFVTFRNSIWRLLPFVLIFGFTTNAVMFLFPIGGEQIPQPSACWFNFASCAGIVRRLPSTLGMVNCYSLK